MRPIRYHVETAALVRGASTSVVGVRSLRVRCPTRCAWLLLLAGAPAMGAPLGARYCADAAARQITMRHIVLDVPQLGLSVIQAQQALERLDMEWKRAFGDTATQPKYQEAVEDYASRARQLVEVALRSKQDKDVPFAPLESARREEALAYSRLEEQARAACPAP